MKTVLLLLLILAICQSALPVTKVVVLMMENRSFDHLLGFLKKIDPRLDGLTGQEFNYYNTSDPSSKVEQVNTNGFDTGPDDPGHNFEQTFEQIYGFPPVHGTDKPVPKMNGFVQNALRLNNTAYNPMSMFTPKTAPIINTLATEFAVFDKWFCALPSSTDPNRAFAMSGTSNGAVTNFNGTLWSQQSFFDFLTDNKISWRAHYQDDPWAIMYFQDMHTKKNSRYVSELSDFLKQVDDGFLPQFTWLQPRMTSDKGAPTWQHPDASVSEGERLIKQIYEKLRNSKFWNEVVFVVTYDEHGGFYDHVAPPQSGIPSPDGVVAPNGFEFDRLGIRIPTVVVSPWIKKNTIVSEPNGPVATSHFDSTSTIASASKILGLNKFLGKRAEWAGTFENIFTLSEPRKDCPTELPPIPEYTEEALNRQRALPLNDHFRIQIDFYCKFNRRGPECGKDLKNQFDASVFLSSEAKFFLDKMRQ